MKTSVLNHIESERVSSLKVNWEHPLQEEGPGNEVECMSVAFLVLRRLIFSNFLLAYDSDINGA